MPLALVIIAWISLATAGVCSVVLAVDVLRHPQHMWIMNLVWPITALYAGPIAMWAYYRHGRAHHHAMQKPFAVTVGLASTHCGAGCVLGDILAEWSIVLIPGLGALLFRTPMFNAWLVDYVLAYLFGIVFQYFTIAPMRKLRIGPGIWAAVRADTLALTAWQIGMYGWMAIAVYLIFGHEIPRTSPVFWFMMQIAMLCGFITSYPMNRWLIRKGLKEEM
jgi:hypothetical protein